jgi:ribosomal protein L21E
MSYGLRQSDSETGWKATYDNFTGDKGVLRVGANTKVLAAPSADNTAVGGEVTVYEFFSSGKSGTIINEDGRSVDFRVESGDNTHMLFVDASADTVHFARSSFTETASGATIRDDGLIQATRSGGDPLSLRRITSYGQMIAMRYGTSSSTVVGSVDVSASGITYNTTSDRRLKENIEPLTNGTDKLMAMNPVTHTWIERPEAGTVQGFIAQEMIDIVPEAVSGGPHEEDMMSMDYGRITPVLVAALQDAHKKIAELEARLNTLEGK